MVCPLSTVSSPKEWFPGQNESAICLQIAIQLCQVHQPDIVGFGLGMGGVGEADANEEGVIDVPSFTCTAIADQALQPAE